MKWIGAVVALEIVVLAVGCASGASFFDRLKAASQPYVATVSLDLEHPGPPVNPRLMGNNVQWVDEGDNLLEAGSTHFAPAMLDVISKLRPTVLRYPGGSNSDTYHWRAGMGDPASRGESEHFHTRKAQKVLFGTVEYLTLCRRLGAEPLITVNVASGPPEEAAEWVRAVNLGHLTGPDGEALGPVRLWEIGNEPYLREDQRKELAVEPAVYAQRANAFIRAMKAVDPTIQVGIPLRSDRLGTIPATPFPGFNDRVLADVKEPYEFVALHDAYLPLLYDAKRIAGNGDVFKATMAATRVVERDLEVTRTLLRKYQPGRSIPIAITEYNALFSIGTGHDGDIASLTGALYVADLLRLLSQTDDILMANFWSLNGNWFFGAVSNRGEIRPSYAVLLAYREALRGRRLPLRVAAPTFGCAAVGIVPAERDLPLVTATATLDEDRVRVVLINKDFSRPATITLDGSQRPIAAVEMKQLTASDPFDKRALASPGLAPVAVAGRAFPLKLTVAPHALATVEIRLARNP